MLRKAGCGGMLEKEMLLVVLLQELLLRWQGVCSAVDCMALPEEVMGKEAKCLQSSAALLAVEKIGTLQHGE